MKQMTSYNRVAGYLNKIFDLLNEAYFNNELTRPTITIQSTPRAYGHFSLSSDTWISAIGNSHEINIGAGTLNRNIEDIVATLLHEMIHYYNYVNGIQDCSRGNTYHNKHFREAAEARGLHVERSDKYGWSHTEPTEELLDFVINNQLADILINRNEASYYGGVFGGRGADGSEGTQTPKKTSSSRKYICPCCGMSVRATKIVRIKCIDCDEEMIEC